jgi:hypothetical protein
MPNGYVQLAGGYPGGQMEAQGGQPFLPPQMQQTVVPQPTQLGLPPQMAFNPQLPPEQGHIPVSQLPQQQQQFTQMRQIPQQGQFFSPQQQAGLQPQYGQQQAQQAPIDLNTRLVGQNIPAELQGRTLGEAIAIHNGLRQVHLQSMAQQPSQGQQQVQQQQVQQPTAPGQGQQTAWDWKNPSASVGQVVDEKNQVLLQRIESMLAPSLQATASAAIQNARNTVAQEFGPIFTQLEPLVLQRLQGSDPRALSNPTMWRLAADSIYGEMSRRGQIQPQQQQPQQVPQVGGMFPAQHVQQFGQPLPNLNGFFSEQPNQGGPGAQGVQLTQAELHAAAVMNQTPEQYAAWKGGVPVNQSVIQQPMQYRMGRMG